jgi:dihydrolipoamide dehydrogenase
MVMGDLVREVDVAVVGGGPGGYSAAFRCAELGLEVVVVDARARLGGACLFEGCIPSKALLHVAGLIAEAERAKELGVEFGAPRISLDPLRKWKDERVVGRLARGLTAVARSKSVDVIGGRAVFESSRELRVEGDTPQKIRFRHAIVATGSRPLRLPAMLAGEGPTAPAGQERPTAPAKEGPAPVGDERLMDSTAALDLADVPERLLVIGGGYIGLELGQVYAALGSAVTLVEMTDGLLPGVDRDLVRPLARQCERGFAAIHLGTRVTALRPVEGGIEAQLGAAAQRFDRVLVAVGRRAHVEGLGLETTRVHVGERGDIAVDERCRTGDAHIYAVGDVTGEPMLAHRAMRQGKVAAEVIAGKPAAFDNAAIPAVVFTDPEVAWCGLTESAAEREGRSVRVAKYAWAASGRASTLGRTDGLTKLVLDPGSGRVLGVGIVGPGAGELIAEAALAVETAVTAEDLAATIHAHPTLAETLMEAAESFLRASA